MKQISSTIKNFFTRKVDIFSLSIGILLSILILVTVHCLMWSFGNGYEHSKRGMYGHKHMEMGRRYDNDMNMNKSNSMNSHVMMKMNTNPYVMGDITSEKQFLEEMIQHHEGAVAMANQVLALPSIHQEVKDLANAIIKAQTTEIQSMKSWQASWTTKK